MSSHPDSDSDSDSSSDCSSSSTATSPVLSSRAPLPSSGTPSPSSRAPPPFSRAPTPSALIGSSRFPSGQPPSSRAPTTMLQGRDSAPPSSRAPSTMLQGRDSAPPSSRAPTTMLQGRDASKYQPFKPELDPIILRSVAPANVTASVLITAEDLERALKQISIDTLSAEERKEQEKWAQDLISKTTNCPEGYAFERRAGGYQCGGGGHGVSDHLLAEGKGGLLACKEVGGEHKWENMEGPYYPNPKGKGYIRGVLKK